MLLFIARSELVVKYISSTPSLLVLDRPYRLVAEQKSILPPLTSRKPSIVRPVELIVKTEVLAAVASIIHRCY